MRLLILTARVDFASLFVQNVCLEAAMKAILTPRLLAEAIGVSESSVKRWVDDGHIMGTRTAGGHRRISIQEATRYIRERELVVVRPDVLGFHDLVASGGARESGGDAGEALLECLRAGAAAEARGLLLSMYLDGSSIAEIVDGPLAFSMEKIGELWVSAPSGVFWEHRATQIAIQALGRLRPLLAPRDEAPVAVGGAPTGDRYVLPSLAVAAVLEGEGLRATNLGPETPIRTLGIGLEDLDARLVWLSVSAVSDGDKLRREIDGLLPVLAARGAILVVGGAQAQQLALPRSDSLYLGRSMVELEALVQGMRLAPRSALASA